MIIWQSNKKDDNSTTPVDVPSTTNTNTDVSSNNPQSNDISSSTIIPSTDYHRNDNGTSAKLICKNQITNVIPPSPVPVSVTPNTLQNQFQKVHQQHILPGITKRPSTLKVRPFVYEIQHILWLFVRHNSPVIKYQLTII